MFYQAIIRREALKKLLSHDDTDTDIRMKMLAVCAGSEPRIDAVLGASCCRNWPMSVKRKLKLVCRCGLNKFLWQQLTRNYGYASEEPGIKDFVR